MPAVYCFFVLKLYNESILKRQVLKVANRITAQDYLTKSESKFRTFKKEWEAFTVEAPEKFFTLVRSGIRPSLSSNSSGNQIGISISFESNMDAAEKYIEKVKIKIEDKGEEIKTHINDIDKNLQSYLDEGIDCDLFSKLVKHLNEVIDYIPEMSFNFSSEHTIEFGISDEILGIKKKWEKVSVAEIRKNEAKKFGVSLADLDKHKTYLRAKEKKNSAKTSDEIKKAEKEFISIKGYLDSANLAKECTVEFSKLKAKEDEEARIKKEREERRKKEEAEKLRRAVEAYEKEVAEIKKAKESYIAEEKSKIESNYNNVISTLEKNYNAFCQKNKTEMDNVYSEKKYLEEELEKAGLFAFGKKKQLRQDIENLDEKLRFGAIERNEYEKKYRSEIATAKKNYDSALKVLPMNAGKKFVFPKDPRK